MDLGEALRTRLLAATAVTDLVGTRVFWVRRSPQGSALPAVVLTAVGGGQEDYDLQDEADFVESRVQVSALASTHAAARSLLKAATDALMGEFTVAPLLFWGGDRERPVDLGSDSEQGFVHNITQDVILRHSPCP
jgi:hypothetical protein